jgi:hypothetical protein
MTACRHCGRPIQLDNTDDERMDAPPEVIAAALAVVFGPNPPPVGQVPLGDFWRHADTGEPGSGFTLCPGSKRYTPDATYAEP